MMVVLSMRENDTETTRTETDEDYGDKSNR